MGKGKKLDLWYGEDKDTGKYINIFDLDKNTQFGLSCNCICPSCRTDLVAVLNVKRSRPYFQHRSKHDCFGGVQTSLHLFGKESIKVGDKIYLPPMNTILGKTEWIEVTIDNIYLEKPADGIIPDITIIAGGKKIYIEIYVTHKVDDFKKFMLLKNGISTLEIDLSRFDKEDINKDFLREIILGKNTYKNWVFNFAEYDLNRQVLEYSTNIENNNKVSAVNTLGDLIDCNIYKKINRQGKGIAEIDKDCVNCIFNKSNNERYLQIQKDEQDMENAILKKYRPKIENEIDINKSKREELLNILNSKRIFKGNFKCLCTSKYLLNDLDDYFITPYINPHDASDKYGKELAVSDALKKSKYKYLIGNGYQNLTEYKCPLCGSDMEHQIYEGGFIGCSNYGKEFTNEYCRFTMKDKERTKLLKNYQDMWTNIDKILNKK